MYILFFYSALMKKKEATYSEACQNLISSHFSFILYQMKHWL